MNTTQLKTITAVAASLIREAFDRQDHVPPALRDAIGKLLGLDPVVVVTLVRHHENAARAWSHATGWDSQTIPHPELASAYADWRAGRAFQDRHGVYRMRPSGGGVGFVAHWNERARALHPHKVVFTEAARRAV